MGTIENINNTIISKIRGLKKVVHLLTNVGIDVSDRLRLKLDDISTLYFLRSASILNKYFSFSLVGQKQPNQQFYREKNVFLSEYQNLLNQENFVQDLDIIKSSLYLLASTDQLKRKIGESLNHINPFTKKKDEASQFKCQTCNIKMIISSNMSQIMCSGCGIKEKLRGMIFEDDQFFQQEGQRTKHGNYDPTKHCKLWVDRIQASETKDIPDKLIVIIKNLAKIDKVYDLKRLSCESIRVYLQKSNNSRYNEHVPLIRKIITGISPPQLNDLERRKIHIYFDKIITIYSEIKPVNKTNTNYHPYYILKILEQIIKNRNRRKEIISCIHLQARETLIEHDILWQKICEHIEEFKYIPTNRHEYEYSW